MIDLPRFTIECEDGIVCKRRVEFLFNNRMVFSIYRFRNIEEIALKENFSLTHDWCNKTFNSQLQKYIYFPTYRACDVGEYYDYQIPCQKCFHIYNLFPTEPGVNIEFVFGKNELLSKMNNTNINIIIPFELFISDILPIL